MDLTSLFESEETDAQARWQAADVHQAIVKWLDTNSGFLWEELQHDPSWGGCFIFPVRRVRRAYPNLYVIFTAKSGKVIGTSGDKQFGSAGGFGTDKNGNGFIFSATLIGPSDPKHLSTRFGAAGRNAFIHEFQHYLMWQRRGERDSSSEKMRSKGVGAYFNDADETNAYYQEAAHSAVEIFKTLANHDRGRQMATWSTPKLVDWIKAHCFFDAFLSHASEKTMRALNKRLARFVEQTIRPILSNGTES